MHALIEALLGNNSAGDERDAEEARTQRVTLVLGITDTEGNSVLVYK